MAKASRFLLLSLVGYGLLVAAGIAVLGLLEQHAHPKAGDGIFVGWGIFIGQFVIFLALIDIPLIVLGLWLAQRIDATIEHVMTETLARALPITARLFTEHWKAQQEAGTLPAPPETPP